MTDIVSNVWVPISRHFRKRRMVEFLHEFSITPATRVLDVGGGRFNWDLVDFRPTLTIVNPYLEPNPLPGVTYVRGDACRLPFADNAFDVVFSNSVIEHVGANRQAEFARECCRVGRRYYIQTPNRRFPIEPHLLTPFIHWMPQRVRRYLIPRATAWALLCRFEFTQQMLQEMYDIHLLSSLELAVLFPQAKIRKERVAGFAKSLIATACQQDAEPLTPHDH